MDGKLNGPIEFQPFNKISRLFRDVVITEKIDGTNAAVGIVEVTEDELSWGEAAPPDTAILVSLHNQGLYAVYAQSRKRLITPTNDNFGFARWVHENAVTLAADLGPGLHFGEWWGSGIQRGYGLEKGEKRFSLFNVKRWNFQLEVPFYTPRLNTVPVLYTGEFNTDTVRDVMDNLEDYGSQAAPGFLEPEGVVIYHVAANALFKATIYNDAAPKSALAENITGSGGIVLPKIG